MCVTFDLNKKQQKLLSFLFIRYDPEDNVRQCIICWIGQERMMEREYFSLIINDQ